MSKVVTMARVSRPPFAETYPRDPALDALVERFEAGDYAAVRDGVKALTSKDPDVLAAARDLASRTEPDPAMKWLMLTVLALIVIVFGFWWARAH